MPGTDPMGAVIGVRGESIVRRCHVCGRPNPYGYVAICSPDKPTAYYCGWPSDCYRQAPAPARKEQP